MSERQCEPTLCSGHSCFAPFVILGPLDLAQTLQKNFFRPPVKAARLELAFRGAISVPAEVRVPGAGRKCRQTSADSLSLIPVQLTSAPPNQDSAFVLHGYSPFSLFWDR